MYSLWPPAHEPPPLCQFALKFDHGMCEAFEPKKIRHVRKARPPWQHPRTNCTTLIETGPRSAVVHTALTEFAISITPIPPRPSSCRNRP